MGFVDLVEFSGDAAPKRGKYLAALMALFAAVITVTAMRFSGWPIAAWRMTSLVDFHDFYLAGALVGTGEAGRAYAFADLMDLQRQMFGATTHAPWTYPPQFDLIVAMFARLPIGLAYATFASASLAAYGYALRKLAPQNYVSVFLLLAPMFVITLRCGQNGFLTGALVAAAAIGLSENRARAGVALGLMALKPHLAVALALHVLITRRWKVALVALAVVAVSSLVATVLLGPAIWADFLGAVREASAFLAAGLYPFYRMASVYAAARSFGFSAVPASAAQAGFALVAFAATAGAVWRFSGRQAVGVAAIVSAMISPYAYDYDLPVFGVGLAMLMPDLARFAGRGERLALYALVMAVEVFAVIMAVKADLAKTAAELPVSAGCLIIPATLIVAWRALERSRAPQRASTAGRGERTAGALTS